MTTIISDKIGNHTKLRGGLGFKASINSISTKTKLTVGFMVLFGLLTPVVMVRYYFARPINTRAALPTYPISSPVTAPVTTLVQKISLSPTDDTFVASDKPTSRYANATTLTVSKTSSVTKMAYIKFDLGALAQKDVTLAKLKLFSADNSKIIHNVKETTKNTWKEVEITYSTRPPTYATMAATFKPEINKSYNDIDLTKLVQQKRGGIIALAIEASVANTDQFVFRSNNYDIATERPILYVEYK